MNKIHALVLGGALATVAALPVQADTIFGVYAGGQLWHADGSGQIGSTGSGDSMSGDFDFGSDVQNAVYIAIEHPVPLVPNVKIKRTALESNGSSSSPFTFKGQAYSGTIASDTDFTHTDLILYYEILDNWVNLDVGLNVMQFDGHVAVSDNSKSKRVDFSGYLPTLYAAVGFDLPLTGWSLNGEFAGIAVSDSSFMDYQAEIAYRVIDNMVVDLTAQLGYRKTTLELDDLDDINSNIDFSGPYIGLEVHF